MMMGVAMVKYGLSIPEALFMSIVVFAGRWQMAVTPLIVAGAPLWVIWATAFCVNLRFVVFSLHLLEGYRHQDVAQLLGITESTSKTQYMRAKRLVRERLGELGELVELGN